MDKRFRISKSRQYITIGQCDEANLIFVLKAIDDKDCNNNAAVVAAFFLHKNDNGIRVSSMVHVTFHEVAIPEDPRTKGCEYLDGRSCRHEVMTRGNNWTQALLENGDDGVWALLYKELEDFLPKNLPITN